MSEEKKDDSFIDKVKEKMEELKERADDVWEKAEEKDEAAWNITKEKAAEIKETISEKIDSLRGKTPDTKPENTEQPVDNFMDVASEKVANPEQPVVDKNSELKVNTENKDEATS